MKKKQRFKLFAGNVDELARMEGKMNEWADALPETARIRRTQLAASSQTAGGPMASSSDEVKVIALVNYEEDDG